MFNQRAFQSLRYTHIQANAEFVIVGGLLMNILCTFKMSVKLTWSVLCQHGRYLAEQNLCVCHHIHYVMFMYCLGNQNIKDV